MAYGTSKKLGRLLAAEFAIRKSDHAAAYALAGLSYDTKFNLAETLALPCDNQFFAGPPNPRHGRMPKLGRLHYGMMKVVEAAMRAARSSGRARLRTVYHSDLRTASSLSPRHVR